MSPLNGSEAAAFIAPVCDAAAGDADVGEIGEPGSCLLQAAANRHMLKATSRIGTSMKGGDGLPATGCVRPGVTRRRWGEAMLTIETASLGGDLKVL